MNQDQNPQITINTVTPGPMNLGVIVHGLMQRLPIPERKAFMTLLAPYEHRVLIAQIITEANQYLGQMAAIESLDSVAFERVRTSVVGLTSALSALNLLGHEYEQLGDSHGLLNRVEDEEVGRAN